MDGNQKIGSSVESCKYNTLNGKCSLTEIQVTPMANVDTKQPDESMCSSYEYDQ